jgi:hypothetical protein
MTVVVVVRAEQPLHVVHGALVDQEPAVQPGQFSVFRPWLLSAIQSYFLQTYLAGNCRLILPTMQSKGRCANLIVSPIQNRGRNWMSPMGEHRWDLCGVLALECSGNRASIGV